MQSILRLRTARGWTQEKLSEESGVSQNYICELEQCKKQPTLKVLKKLSKAFNVPISELTDEEA